MQERDIVATLRRYSHLSCGVRIRRRFRFCPVNNAEAIWTKETLAPPFTKFWTDAPVDLSRGPVDSITKPNWQGKADFLISVRSERVAPSTPTSAAGWRQHQ
jgi:hypothetical protein